MRARSLIPLAAAALALSGCAIGRNYHRPDVGTPAAHRDTTTVVPPADSLASFADLPWWDAMPDTTLRALVRDALAGNHDLRIAVARVEAARARSGIAGAPIWPSVSAGLSGSRLQRSEDETGAKNPPAANVFQGGLFAAWEVDVFGRVRREKEAAVAEALAAEYDWRGVTIALVAEVARQYVSLRELDERLDIAHATLESRQATLKLFTQRKTGGVASRLETAQAEGDLQDVAAQIPDLERGIALSENSLNALLGRNPGPIVRDTMFTIVNQPAEVPAGLPSQLLERRPDVMAAEQRLRAANARTGAATALYFPNISLSGFLGGTSLELANLTKSPAAAWSVGGSVFQPLFEGGRIRNLNREAQAEYDASLEQYVAAAQQSFRDVSDALISLEKLHVRVARLVDRVAALKDGVRLAKVRYEGGLSSYLEVLDADRQYFAGANDLAGAQGDLWRSYIELYRALGGGWTPEPEGANK